MTQSDWEESQEDGAQILNTGVIGGRGWLSMYHSGSGFEPAHFTSPFV